LIAAGGNPFFEGGCLGDDPRRSPPRRVEERRLLFVGSGRLIAGRRARGVGESGTRSAYCRALGGGRPSPAGAGRRQPGGRWTWVVSPGSVNLSPGGVGGSAADGCRAGWSVGAGRAHESAVRRQLGIRAVAATEAPV